MASRTRLVRHLGAPSRSARGEGGERHDRVGALRSKKAMRTPLGASPLANRQSSSGAALVPRGMQRTAGPSMRRSLAGRRSGGSSEGSAASEYDAFNNFYVRCARARCAAPHALRPRAALDAHANRGVGSSLDLFR